MGDPIVNEYHILAAELATKEEAVSYTHLDVYKRQKWSVPGDTPYMFETKGGKVGIDICRDGHFYPELGRYYAAMGCTLFILSLIHILWSNMIPRCQNKKLE